MITYHRNQIHFSSYQKITHVQSNQIQIKCDKECIMIKGIDLKIILLNELELMIEGEIHVIQIYQTQNRM